MERILKLKGTRVQAKPLEPKISRGRTLMLKEWSTMAALKMAAEKSNSPPKNTCCDVREIIAGSGFCYAAIRTEL